MLVALIHSFSFFSLDKVVVAFYLSHFLLTFSTNLHLKSMVDSIVEYISSTDPNVPPSPNGSVGLRQNNRKVLYALCNSLGSIILVYESSRRCIRKANVSSHLDIRLNNPVEYLNNMASEVGTTVLIGPNATVNLMYCHRQAEKLRSHCQKLLLLGAGTCIVFADYRTGTEDAQLEHAQRCSCGHMCFSTSPTFTLRPGDRISINSGHFYVSASSDKHVIYMTKREFLNQITFHSDGGTDLIDAFVNSLPDSAEPMVT